jgi:pimeloyl-ACP methyl ester carboxylesterase
MWKKLFYLIFKCGVPTNQVFPIVFGSDQLKHINIPTLLIYGNRENIYNTELSIKYAQNAIENIKIEIIPGANHLTALTQPTLTNEAILRFFEISCQEKACI